MTRHVQAREAMPIDSRSLGSWSADGVHDESAVHPAQLPPPAPTPPVPAVQGMPADARQAIVDAIREAQLATSQAREEARAAQRATRVQVDGEQIIVTPGAQGGGGSGRGGETIVLGEPAPHPFPEIPPRAFDVAIAFFVMIAFIAVGTSIARAFGRRADRRPLPAAATPELSAQLQRIEHAVEAMAIEVERISEAQRYMARLESERGADPARLARPARRD